VKAQSGIRVPYKYSIMIAHKIMINSGLSPEMSELTCVHGLDALPTVVMVLHTFNKESYFRNSSTVTSCAVLIWASCPGNPDPAMCSSTQRRVGKVCPPRRCLLVAKGTNTCFSVHDCMFVCEWVCMYTCATLHFGIEKVLACMHACI
jgi:hypothetical protein